MTEERKKLLVLTLSILLLSQIWFPMDMFRTHWRKRNVFVNELLWDMGQITELSGNLLEQPTAETAREINDYLEQFIFHDTWRSDAMHFDWFKETNAYRKEAEDLKLRILYQRFYFPILDSAADGALTEEEISVLENLHRAFQDCYLLLADEDGEAKAQALDKHYLDERLDRLTVSLDLRE